MKTRNGFVSNSSSSSFIIALKKVNIPCPHCGRKDPDFLDIIEQSESNRTSKSHVENLITQDTIDCLVNEQDWIDAEHYKELKKSIAKYRDNNEWIIANVTISHHDNHIRETLYDMVDNGNAEVLYTTEN